METFFPSTVAPHIIGHVTRLLLLCDFKLVRAACMLASTSSKCFIAVTQCDAFQRLQERMRLASSLATIERSNFPRDLNDSWSLVGAEFESLASEGGRAEGIEQIGRLCHFLSTIRMCPWSLDERKEFCERLCETNPVAQNLLHGWFSTMTMRGDLFHALFRFLRHFPLPGEASKIDRALESFAHCWFEANQQDAVACPFATPDAVYVLCYSMLMLNTDAHHPGVKTKMSMQDFCAANRGVNDGKDFPQGFLDRIYQLVTDPGQRLLKDVWEDEGSLVVATPAGRASTPNKSWIPDGCRLS